MSDRNFVLAGMSRGGTTLLAKLITEHLPNAYCAIEPPNAGFADELPEFFESTREKLINGLPVGQSYAKDGSIADNPWRTGAEWEEKPLEKPFTEQCAVGVKGILTLLKDAEEILENGWRMVIILRDPYYALGAWNDPAARYMDVAKIEPDDLHPVFQPRREGTGSERAGSKIYGALLDVPFTHTTKIERQAELWEYFAQITLRALKSEHAILIRYEDLCDTTPRELVRLADFLHVPRPASFPTLQNMNRVREYPYMQEIHKAVRALCPSRIALGFSE